MPQMAIKIGQQLSMRVCGRMNNNIYVLIKVKEYFNKLPKMPNPCIPSKSFNQFADSGVNTVSITSFLNVLSPDAVMALVTWNGKDKLVNVRYNEENMIEHFDISSASDWIMKAFKQSISYRFQIAAVYQEDDELFHLFQHPEAGSRTGIDVYSVLAFEEVAWEKLKKNSISVHSVNPEDNEEEQPIAQENDDDDVFITKKGTVSLNSRAINRLSGECCMFQTPTVSRKGIRSYNSECKSRYTALGKIMTAHRNCIKIPSNKHNRQSILRDKPHGGAMNFCLYAGGTRHIAVAAAASKPFSSVRPSMIHSYALPELNFATCLFCRYATLTGEIQTSQTGYGYGIALPTMFY